MGFFSPFLQMRKLRLREVNHTLKWQRGHLISALFSCEGKYKQKSDLFLSFFYSELLSLSTMQGREHAHICTQIHSHKGFRDRQLHSHLQAPCAALHPSRAQDCSEKQNGLLNDRPASQALHIVRLQSINWINQQGI